MGVHMDALNSGGSEYVAAVERIKQIIGLRPRTPLYWYDPVFYKTAAGKQVYSDIELTHSFTNQVRSRAGAGSELKLELELLSCIPNLRLHKLKTLNAVINSNQSNNGVV